MYLGLCDGADTNFIDLVQQFIGNPDVYGFYLVDEPDPTGEYSPQCPATDLKAESDWIHANDPGTVTFIVLMNLGTPTQPTSWTPTTRPTPTSTSSVWTPTRA